MKDMKLTTLLVESLKPEQMIKIWKSSTAPADLRLYCKRDNCGPAATDFLSFFEKLGVTNLKRIEGFFKADEPVYDKNDFTSDMKREFLRSGLDWNSAEDRKQWIANSQYAEQWKYIPHYWVEDSNGAIYDVTGREQFIDTGLATDLDSDRYTLTDKI